MERISPDFEGTFKMYLDKDAPYTFKSKYLQNARLTGEKNSNLEGNDLENILMGNKGNNKIDGGAGQDVLQFTGSFTEYRIGKEGDVILVKDQKGKDGENILRNIEILRFTDKDIEVDTIK